MHFILYLNTEFFYRFKYLSLVMILCFLINQIILIHPPLPTPTLYGYLDSGTSDIHRRGPATASYVSLSMGI